MGDRVLVTGASGLIGSNICRMLLAQGTGVRGLVRSPGEASELAALGVDLRGGDVRDGSAVDDALAGCVAVVHAAALLGGTGQDDAAFGAVNAAGTGSVLDTAARHGARAVVLTTISVLDRRVTMTETSPLTDDLPDPYARSKRAAYDDAMRRVAVGADIVLVAPANTFGPAPVVGKAMAATSFNRLIRGAVNGRLATYPDLPGVWGLASDVAAVCVAALDRGVAGRRYLAFGSGDAVPSVELYNRACELAGVTHRVRQVDLDPQDPDVRATYGESMASAIGRVPPRPAADSSATQAELDVSFTPVDDALRETVDWLRATGQLR